MSDIKKELLNALGRLAQPLEYLDLDTRAFHCLKRFGIKYIYEVALMSEEELRSIRNCGQSTVNHIYNRLERYIPELETLITERSDK